MRAVLYARVSRDDDGTSKSPDQQLEECRAYAQRHGWSVEAEHVDRDISGWSKTASRPGLNATLDLVRSGAVDVVLVWALDRLTRQGITGLGRILTTLEDADVELHSATEDLSNEIVLSVYASMAKMESETKSNRVNRAFKHHAQEGKPPPSGKRLFGYADRSYSAINEDEAQWVRAAVAGVLDGDSVGKWADIFEANGVLTSQGNRWTLVTLSRYLKNPTIAGYRVYDNQRYKGTWEPLITQEQYAQLMQLRPKVNRATELRNPFVSVIYCYCGAKMTAHPSGRTQYICTAQRRAGNFKPHKAMKNGRIPKGCAIDQDIVDGFLYEYMQALLANSPRLTATSTEAVERQLSECQEELAALEDRSRQLSTDYYAKGLMSADVYDSTTAAIASQRSSLESRYHQASNQLKSLRAQNKVQSDALVEWFSMSIAERKELVEAWIERIEVGPPTGSPRTSNPVDRLTITVTPDVLS